MDEKAATLIEALVALEPHEDVRQQLQPSDKTTLVLQGSDLAGLDDETLLEADTFHMSRVTYVVGLARLSRFLRAEPTLDGAEGQARLALAFVKHAEDKHLEALQLGRVRNDDKFAREVAAMREELRGLSEIRAKNTVKEAQHAKDKRARGPLGKKG